MKVLNLWDELFFGVTVVEAINKKDLINTVAWLSHNRKIELSEEALALIKSNYGWHTWAKTVKKTKHFVRI